MVNILLTKTDMLTTLTHYTLGTVNQDSKLKSKYNFEDPIDERSVENNLRKLLTLTNDLQQRKTQKRPRKEAKVSIRKPLHKKKRLRGHTTDTIENMFNKMNLKSPRGVDYDSLYYLL